MIAVILLHEAETTRSSFSLHAPVCIFFALNLLRCRSVLIHFADQVLAPSSSCTLTIPNACNCQLKAVPRNETTEPALSFR